MSDNAKTIYFAQHGLAVDKSDDAERPLSNKGIEQTQSVANRLSILNIPVSTIFHSGKLRAAQTAEIFAATIGVSNISAASNLSPNDDIDLLIDKLTENNALYVGHLPHLEKLTSFLVSRNNESDIIKFQNSAVVCLMKNNKQYQIKWFLTPELADKL